MNSRPLLLALILAPFVLGQPATQFEAWTPPPGESRIPPKAACASLRALTGYEFSVVTASLVSAAGTTPEYCRVAGLIAPEVKFEVALPTSWHGRLVMIGNGGFAGEDLQAPGRAGARDAAVRAGFAFTQTNTGHDAAGEPLGEFAINPQKLVDYAFRAVHVTVETAKRVAAAYYGAAPKRSYFFGCSTGGRQGLMAAQRFPNDFDGIVAGAPVLDFTGTMLKYVSILQAFAKAPVPQSKLRLAGKVLYAQCDEKDGVKDGLIDDPRRCGFKPAEHLPKCQSGDMPDCFTDGQIRSLETLYSDQQIRGQRAFPGWPLGVEAERSDGNTGWHNWLVGENQPPIFAQFSEAFFRYVARPQKNPRLTFRDVDVEEPLGPIRAMLDATDTDLGAFRDRGGKLLTWFGWADQALNPNMGVEYYEGVLRKMGPGAKDFYRLFMAPGMFHCAGGIGCDSNSYLAAVIDWVERGKAPDTLPASRTVAGKVVRTRPFCPYPQVAKYKGSGSIDEASSFVCQ